MGMVVSSVVSTGPAVLEDLDARYVVLRERKTKDRERQKSRSTQKTRVKEPVSKNKEKNVLLVKFLTFKTDSTNTKSHTTK